ncbi:unnamed protein product [Wuchereria bancrofti]|uniref:Uncharacterized protein n=2 Tax=Wuchereria bancrofti TaxID=6293 RepID=A0A3P7E519_WUCBA|nr:unnamed protein product [Wuchereria bancrofti]
MTTKHFTATQLDMSEFFTAENPTVNNLIFDSEESTLNCGQSEQSLQTALKVTEITSHTLNFALNRFHKGFAYVQLKVSSSGSGLVPVFTSGLVRQDMDHIYTVGNVPTHQIVLIRKCMLCEAKFAAVRTFASTEKIKIMTAMQIKKGVTAAKAEFDNEIVWQIGVIFCAAVMSFLVLKILHENDILF